MGVVLFADHLKRMRRLTEELVMSSHHSRFKSENALEEKVFTLQSRIRINPELR